MSACEAKPNQKKMIILMSLGLLIPVFLLSMAYLAVTSDEKNQAEYARIKAENLARIQARDAAQATQASSEVDTSTVAK